jgi:archaellum component FlaC
MDIQNAYKQKREAQLKEWGAQINLMEAKLENVSADMKVKGAEQIQALRAQQHSASEKMKELGKATGEAWEDVKTTADKVWDDLKSGVAEAHSKFK